MARSIALVVLLVAVLGGATSAEALFAGAFTENACQAGKMKCIAKKAKCLFTCHHKALKAGAAVDPTCLARCRDAFEAAPAVPGRGCFAKVETKGGCGASVGDSATIAAAIDAQVVELATEIAPAGGPLLNACAAGKTACVGKYTACVLGRTTKAMRKGTPIGDLAQCTRFLDGSDESCAGKLELKYIATAQACPKNRDQVTLRRQIDAFADDAIAALVVGPHDMNTQRCTGNTSVPCTSAPGGVAGCGGPLGTCEFWFGAPLPYAAGGVATCVTNQWNGTISGTFDEATGASAGAASVVSRVYNGIVIARPCPVCDGDAFPNDGVSGGTCLGGARNTLPCDGNGVSPDPSFGTTSLDCPPAPGGLISTFAIDLTNTDTGTIAKTVGPGSPTCSGAPGKTCLCGSCSLDSQIPCQDDAQCAAAGAGTCTSPAGEPRRPNDCLDDTAVPGDGTICAPQSGGEGACSEGPLTTHCKIDFFRGCTNDGDCPADHDFCTSELRDCFVGYNGDVGDAVTARGSTSDPRNGAAVLQFAAVFCMAPTLSGPVNSVAGFPGPGRVELLGVGQDDGGPGCPTKASFLPTSKAPVIDVGWTGIAHDNLPIGNAKVTVAATCTGTHPNCSCSYTGPIAN